jgi:hypothetical protein
MTARLSLSLTLLAGACVPGRAQPLTVLVSPAGQVALSRGRAQVGTLAPGLAEKEWRFAGLGAALSGEPASRELRSGRIKAPGGVQVDCELRPQVTAAGVTLRYRLTPQGDVYLNSLHVALDFAADVLVGGGYTADGETGAFPQTLGDIHLHSARMSDLQLRLADGSDLLLKYEQPTQVLIQDNRQWGPTFSVRMGPQLDAAQVWPAGKPLEIAFTLTATGGVDVKFDDPVTIEAGDEWIPLKVDLDIEPGSALDFSGFGQLDAPAGKHGWIVARPDGHLAFAADPNTPRRFYGANFCFSAHYIAHEQADQLADRLMRLGYNTIRFHHYEGELVDRSGGTSTKLNPEKLDQLDYLFAALKKRGIYVTTDLFVSRPVFANEVFPGAEGNLEMDEFKMLVPVNANAMQNWKAFARNLLTHANPYTSLRYADDPTLAWLSMINEGNFGNFTGRLSERAKKDWESAWQAWQTQRYGKAEKTWGSQPDFNVFLAETDRRMCGEMRTFLREEIGTKALLTNMNGWSNPIQNQASRQDYDYVDDHFYVDHPNFLEQPWRLPSRCNNTSPVAGGATGGRHITFTRLLDKPFTLSEYNYSGPGRFRGVGGILTGCMGAVQDWSVIWRFAYSHSRANLFAPGAANYFDLAADPLNLAADRASVCLFLRGDMEPAKHSVGIAMTEGDLVDDSPKQTGVAPNWHALALLTRVGTYVGDKCPADLALPVRGGDLDPYAGDTGQKLVADLRARGWLSADNKTDLSRSILQSDNGQLLVDAPRDVLVLNTPRTAGCYAPEGETVECGPLTITLDKTDATVWVSSLDGKPLAESKRLLITHLTDLQNSGAKFGERARQTLLDWGRLPHVVLDGRATVRLSLPAAKGAEVWALSTSGKRVAKVAAELKDGVLTVPVTVKGADGARMVYEVAVTG